MKHIAVIGEICLDVIMHQPRSVEVHGHNIWAGDIITTIGGSAALTSAALAHLGEPVKIFGTIGDDDAGDKIMRILQSACVDCSGITVLPGEKTTVSMIVCNKDQKDFLGCSPMLPLVIPDVDSLNQTKLVYVAGFLLYKEFWGEESIRYFKKARQMGIPIVTDGQCTGIDAFDLDPNAHAPYDEMLLLSDVFLAAKKELRHLLLENDEPGQACKMLKTGLKTLVIKRGAKGAVAFDADSSYEAEGYPVDVYDSVGSGDIFGAAYAYGILNGWPAKDCVEFATIFAACSLLEYKDRKQYPSLESVLKALKNRRDSF